MESLIAASCYENCCVQTVPESSLVCMTDVFVCAACLKLLTRKSHVLSCLCVVVVVS